ncbi:MAG: 16S rRNA (uracil(1498)-N(3))-methyltransferase [Defluviitaleaceae bacterium]|nr:16S rRNA (uracil(1498)-N(3))-methyltransferase [Defluviitaleaceae bacterium]
MPRFFVDKDQITGKQIRITGDDAKHIGVLRMKPGDEISVCEGEYVYICKIADFKKAEVIADIIDMEGAVAEPAVAVTLFQGIPKSAKMELIIQKAVELGVSEIVPVITARSVSEPGGNKTARWRKISEAAAKQSGRGIIPAIKDPVDFETAAQALGRLDEAYAAWEKENEAEALASAVFSGSRGKTTGIMIGPEGGLADNEISLLKQHNVKTFSLGKRILRTETAGFAAVICLMMNRGEM